jgi:hypothetical protein
MPEASPSPERIKVELDEGRMFALVVQVLVGFQFQGVYQPGFGQRSLLVQGAGLASLGLLLLSLALVLSISSCHRLKEGGRDSASFQRTASRLLSWALLPFALAVGLSLFVVTTGLLRTRAALLFGALASGLCLLCWYAIPLVRRVALKLTEEDPPMEKQPSELPPLQDRIKQVLTEGRVILPGTQALLGFQLVSFLTEAFQKLPKPVQVVHLVALGFVVLSATFLITVPAYHRIGEGGGESEHFLRVASRLLLSALAALALGISMDFFVVVLKVTGSMAVALAAAAGALGVFSALWFGFPLLCKARP